MFLYLQIDVYQHKQSRSHDFIYLIFFFVVGGSNNFEYNFYSFTDYSD